MSDIFKVLCQDVVKERRFGICDDKPNQRAYLDIADGGKWMAVVENDLEHKVTFTAIDNCIEIKRPDGTMENRCEGVLTYKDTIIFVEIKERKGGAKAWGKTADDQLRATIKFMEDKINLDGFSVKRAAITNRLERGSTEKHSARMKKFVEDTGYVLRINNRIKL